MAIGYRGVTGVGDEHRRARRRGKSFELLVAKALNGYRPKGGNRGSACSDIGGVPWSVEVTRTAKVWQRLRPKWEQAERNAKLEGREPVLIAAYPRQRLGDALVVCRFELFQSLGKEDNDVVLAEGNFGTDTDADSAGSGVGGGESVDGDVGVVGQDGANEAEL
jgi:hypothetical protein